MASLRAPGLLESYHLARHAMGMDTCILSAARYAHSEKLSLSQQLLFPAVRSIICQHPVLCVRISDERVSPIRFIRLDSIDLSEIIRYVDQSSQNLEQVIESELSKPFDTSRDLPLWRLTVLNDNNLIFAYHHGIGDGMSSMAFHRTLLRALQAQKEAPDSFSTKVFIPEELNLIAPSDQLIDVSPSWLEIIRAILGLFIPPSWTSASRSWTGFDVPAQIPSLQTHVRIIHIPAKDVQRLTEFCRTHKATITSALFFMIISSLSSTLQSPSYLPLITDKSVITSTIPVSLRPQTGVSKDAICNHPSTIFVHPPINPLFSWSDAASLASTLRTQSKTCKSQIGLLNLLFGNYAGFYKGKLGKKRQVGAELSNIGRFELDEDQNEQLGLGWEIQDMVFAQCDVVIGGAIKVNVASAPSGNMAICVTWGDYAVESDLVGMFISGLKHQISELV